MKSIFTSLLLFVGALLYSQSCDPEPKVLIAGDSWAQYMSDDGTHNDIFDKFGHPDFNLLGPSLGTSFNFFIFSSTICDVNQYKIRECLLIWNFITFFCGLSAILL